MTDPTIPASPTPPPDRPSAGKPRLGESRWRFAWQMVELRTQVRLPLRPSRPAGEKDGRVPEGSSSSLFCLHRSAGTSQVNYRNLGGVVQGKRNFNQNSTKDFRLSYQSRMPRHLFRGNFGRPAWYSSPRFMIIVGQKLAVGRPQNPVFGVRKGFPPDLGQGE
jgi:hypothetical protein